MQNKITTLINISFKSILHVINTTKGENWVHVTHCFVQGYYVAHDNSQEMMIKAQSQKIALYHKFATVYYMMSLNLHPFTCY